MPFIFVVDHMEPPSKRLKTASIDVNSDGPSCYSYDLSFSIFNFINECKKLNIHSEEFSYLQYCIDANATDQNDHREILDRISRLLLLPDITLLASIHFRPILVDLCGRLVISDDTSQLLLKLSALSIIVLDAPQCSR